MVLCGYNAHYVSLYPSFFNITYNEHWYYISVFIFNKGIDKSTYDDFIASFNLSLYSTIGNKYYYQIAEIKRCLRAHTIKSSEEMLQNLIAHKRNSKAKASANVQ